MLIVLCTTENLMIEAALTGRSEMSAFVLILTFCFFPALGGKIAVLFQQMGIIDQCLKLGSSKTSV